MKTGLVKTVASDLFSAGSHFSIILGRSPDLQAESMSRFQVSPPSPDKAEWHIGETSPANSGGTAPELHRLPYYVLPDTLDIYVPRIPPASRRDVKGLYFWALREPIPTVGFGFQASKPDFWESNMCRHHVHAQEKRGQFTGRPSRPNRIVDVVASAVG
jgi:hypothetical protein